MPMQTLEQFERRFRLFEQTVGKNIEKRVRLIEQQFEEKVERPFRLIEQRIGRNIETRIRRFEQKTASASTTKSASSAPGSRSPWRWARSRLPSKMLARAMARYVDPDGEGPVIELGPGTGPVTEALIERGVILRGSFWSNSIRSSASFSPSASPKRWWCRRTPIGCASRCASLARHDAAAVVSGLPLMTKPLRMRMRLLREALALLQPSAPFVQFTYAVVPPIPKLNGVRVEASRRIWRNVPPARVWVYRQS